jgi:hypothetical protein
MVLGQNGYSLTCDVAVTGSISNSITYQWTKNIGSQTIPVGTDRVLSFSPLRLSDAGQYACQATVCPINITMMDTHDVTVQSEFSYTITGAYIKSAAKQRSRAA